MTGKVQLALLALGLLVHFGVAVPIAKTAVWETRNARDFASYYYAWHVAADGGDPYKTLALTKLAKAEGTRVGPVQPYFYPPPFLYTMAWVHDLPLRSAYRAMLVLNEVLLFASLAVLVRGFGVSVGAVGLLLAVWSPIPDNLKMGQANLVALLPGLLGLWLARTRPWVGGVLLGIAAMFKMSPALFLLYWILRREWKPCVAAGLTAILLSVLSLPICGFALQQKFYLTVMPGFAQGDYHGLGVWISLSANHSIPDIFNNWWPGPSRTALSETALWASRALTAAILIFWGFRAVRLRDQPGRVLGALTILMVTIPTYAYEHHLVFLLLPAGALMTGLLAAEADPAHKLRSRIWQALALLTLAAVAWPLDVLNLVLDETPKSMRWLVRESKFLGLTSMFFMLLAPFPARAKPG